MHATTTPDKHVEDPGAARVLTLSTVAFTLLFAVWLMLGVLGVPIKTEFGADRRSSSRGSRP